MSARGLDEIIVPDGRPTALGERMPAYSGSRATLTAGNKGSYPGQGPCLIGRVVKRVVDGRVTMFYHLTMLDESGGDLFVPVDKANAIGIRLLMKKSEIPGLLAHLQNGAKAADSWKQRASDNMKLFTSGSPFDLAEIISSLTELRESKSLTLGESGMLGRAMRLLVCEISEVMGETKTEASEQIDRALKARRGESEPARVLSELATGA
jgi:RNA polymerase-interacting CarD/CdnL/TRCF family regulator